MDADRLQNVSRYLRENAEIITAVCVVFSVALGTALYLLTREPVLPDPVYRPAAQAPAVSEAHPDASGPSESEASEPAPDALEPDEPALEEPASGAPGADEPAPQAPDEGTQSEAH